MGKRKERPSKPRTFSGNFSTGLAGIGKRRVTFNSRGLGTYFINTSNVNSSPLGRPLSTANNSPLTGKSNVC
ncbi:hypothetical protein THIOM_000533 [Candidatus Thiomargarita nelsonii]|uniref:Uncharacterized protein n=1 Tax=Candidatus Thiomargarita nelsonii TaxID=1003181 RepID=A0A176S6K2_9GAMM|nr:hypothetical protein THIOM_000533 [Candidatus Thiomargarita nelsonii]